MKKKQDVSNQKIEGQQEETLLGDGNQEVQIDPPNPKPSRKYIPFLPRIYWFFYRKPIYFLAFIPAFASGFLSIGNTISIAYIVDAINKENGLQLIKKYAFYQFMLTILNGFLTFIKFYSWKLIQDSITIKMKRVVFKSIMMKDIEFYDQNKYSDIDIKLNQNVEEVASVFSESKAEQISIIGNLFSCLIFCFSLEWHLSLFAILFTIADTRITGLLFDVSLKYYKIKRTHESNRQTIMREAIANIRTIFSFNSQKHEIERSKYECDFFCSATSASNMYMKTSFGLASFNYQGALCLFLNIGSFFVLKRNITPGLLFSLSIEAFQLASHIICVLSFYSSEKYFIDRGNDILELIESQPKVPFTNENRILNDFTGQIEFRDVWFKYPSRDVWVLKNVSFIVKPGEITAFVGHSGSGKSTIVQLLLRFYDVDQGEILIDNINIKDYPIEFLHHKIGVVQQDPRLFTLSIRDNISYSNVDATENEIVNAAKIANADAFINDLPEKYNTMCGEKGSFLSGGQIQRIAIARVVIENPALLITDEATSALDAESESLVQDALEKVMSGRTSIIIAHRLGTIRAASNIYVFDQGSIVEKGTHENLLQLKGVYFNLVQRQLN